METAEQTVGDASVPPRVAHLLDVAREAFVENGFDGVSIDAIAKMAEVSKETIYRHFPDKQALFMASLDEMANRFTATAEAIMRAGGRSGISPSEELADLAEAILSAASGGGLLSPSWLAAGLGTRMPAFAAELQAAQIAQMEPVHEAIVGVARRKGVAREIAMEDALAFGSLSVEGSALLMGFAPRAGDARRVLSARVAALFEHGLLGLPAGLPVPDRGEGDAFIPIAPEQPPHLRRLLAVAARHFLRDGFEAASLGEIGAEAKVGRGTLYRHFASKAGLFDAVLRDLASQVAAAARAPRIAAGAGARDLAGYFAAMTSHLTGASSIALHRAAISASRRVPALARTVHDRIRAPWIGPLADWIMQTVGHADSKWLAGQGIVLAMQGNRAIAAGRGPSGDALQRHAERTATLFLHGLGR